MAKLDIGRCPNRRSRAVESAPLVNHVNTVYPSLPPAIVKLRYCRSFQYNRKLTKNIATRALSLSSRSPRWPHLKPVLCRRRHLVGTLLPNQFDTLQRSNQRVQVNPSKVKLSLNRQKSSYYSDDSRCVGSQKPYTEFTNISTKDKILLVISKTLQSFSQTTRT